MNIIIFQSLNLRMFLFKKHICAGSPLDMQCKTTREPLIQAHSLHTTEEQDAINIKEALCIFLSDSNKCLPASYAAMYTIQCVMCERSGASEKERERVLSGKHNGRVRNQGLQSSNPNM